MTRLAAASHCPQSNPAAATPRGGRGETCPARSSARRRELAARGRSYSLTPTFPRLPGIIPEDPSSGDPPLAGPPPLSRPSVLSKNRAHSIAYSENFDKGSGQNICAGEQLVNSKKRRKKHKVNNSAKGWGRGSCGRGEGEQPNPGGYVRR